MQLGSDDEEEESGEDLDLDAEDPEELDQLEGGASQGGDAAGGSGPGCSNCGLRALSSNTKGTPGGLLFCD